MSSKLSAEWGPFASRLSEALAVLGEDEYLVLSEKQGQYFVQFAAQGPYGLRVEAVSDRFLDASAQYDEAQRSRLRELHWAEPTEDPDHPDGSPNYWREFELPVAFDEAATLTVDTLVSVHGVRHPGQLRYRAFDQDGREILLPTLRISQERVARGDEHETTADGAAVESLRADVLRLTREVADPSIEFDEDGDVVVRYGTALVIIRVLDEPLLVRVLSPILFDVDDAAEALAAVNELNDRYYLMSFALSDGAVWASFDVLCAPFVAQHFEFAVVHLGQVADELDDVLQDRLGGRRYVDEEKPASPSGWRGYL